MGVASPPKVRVWSKEELATVRAEYESYAVRGALKDLAKKLGRDYSTLAGKACDMGITKVTRSKPWKLKIKDESQARALFDKFKRCRLGLAQFSKRYGMHPDLIRRHVAPRWPDEWELVIESKAPQQTHYRIGRQFEYRVRDLFREAGYFVLRSPGSKSPVDLVAMKTGALCLVQCKRGGTIVCREWNKLFRLADSVGATAILAEMPTGYGTLLWRMTGIKDGTKKAQPRVPYPLVEGRSINKRSTAA